MFLKRLAHIQRKTKMGGNTGNQFGNIVDTETNYLKLLWSIIIKQSSLDSTIYG